MSEWINNLGNRVIDWLGILLLVLVGAALASGIFLLRVIPNMERTAAEKAHEEADKRADAIREKIAAAKKVREAEAEAARAAVCRETSTADESSVETANEYISGDR